MKISESDKKNELESIKHLLRYINYEMSFKDEFYVLDSVLKIVHSKEHGFWIKKFNVVEVKSQVKSRVVKTIEAFTLLGFGGDDLIEWRFKEGPPEPKPFNSDYTALIFADPIIAPTETPAPEITEWHLASRLPEEDYLPRCFPEIPVDGCYKHSQLSDEEELALVTELGLSLESSDEDDFHNHVTCDSDEVVGDDIYKHATYYDEGW